MGTCLDERRRVPPPISTPAAVLSVSSRAAPSSPSAARHSAAVFGMCRQAVPTRTAPSGRRPCGVGRSAWSPPMGGWVSEWSAGPGPVLGPAAPAAPAQLGTAPPLPQPPVTIVCRGFLAARGRPAGREVPRRGLVLHHQRRRVLRRQPRRCRRHCLPRSVRGVGARIATLRFRSHKNSRIERSADVLALAIRVGRIATGERPAGPGPRHAEAAEAGPACAPRDPVNFGSIQIHLLVLRSKDADLYRTCVQAQTAAGGVPHTRSLLAPAHLPRRRGEGRMGD